MSSLDEREIARVTKLMLDPNAIFVFGSNRAGVHGAGAAATAAKLYGAVYGRGEGLWGRSYALPTKDEWLRTLPLHDVALNVRVFISVAMAYPEMRFAVTRVGCGLAGFTDAQIAPLFAAAPSNCELPEGWRPASFMTRDWCVTAAEDEARADKQADGESGSR